MSEYSELKSTLEDQNKKLDRLLSWAEGDEKLGTPSIAQQIQQNHQEIVLNRKRIYENRERINGVDNDVKAVKKQQAGISAGSGGIAGGIIVGIVEAFKALFS